MLGLMLCTQAAFASALCWHGEAPAQPVLMDVEIAAAEHAGCHESLPSSSSAPAQDGSTPESALQCRVHCLSATQTLDKPKPPSLPAPDMPLALPGASHAVTLTAYHTQTLHSALPWPPPACRSTLQRSHRLLI
ncbi:MAG: hypothetical protein EBU07_17585 [Betaproteobacteria bacterium]|nr:hypothetical protein [Betaproteobacteria bacterium]